MPEASPVFAAQPIPASPLQTPSDTPRLKRTPSTAARAQSNASGLLGPILLGGSVGGLILVVVGVGFYLAGPSPEPSPPVVAEAPHPTATEGGGTATTMPRRLDEIPEDERPQPEVYTPPAVEAAPSEFEPLNMTPEPAPSMSMEPEPSPTTSPMTSDRS